MTVRVNTDRCANMRQLVRPDVKHTAEVSHQTVMLKSGSREPTCVGKKDELVVLLEYVVIAGVQVGHSVVCREAATQNAGAETPPHVTILHAGHLGEVAQVERNAVRRLLKDGGVYAGHSRLRNKESI